MVLLKAQDSAPRAADAARYARARKNATETYVKGAGRRGLRLFGANVELIIMPRGACAELIPLRGCAVCLLISRSERQYVCYLGGGGGRMGTERGQSTEESKKTSTQRVHKPDTCTISGTTTAI